MATDAPKKPEAEDRIHSAFPGDLPVDKDNLWAGDCANRKMFAEKFTKIIGGIGTENSAVFLLDGEWGSGKTYFLERFRCELEKREYKAIYFNAFAEDFSADPLVAICGQLWEELGDNSTKGDKLKEVLAGFMPFVLKELFKYSTGISPDIVNKASEAVEGAVKKENPPLFVDYSKSRRSLQELKNKLSSEVRERSEGKPLVFIIDELDRCRPTFALELLERIKHLFEVPGIIFIFGAKKEALKQSVRSQYGDQDDTYLEKFFDFDLKLPDAPSHILARKYIENSNIKNIATNMFDMLNNLYYPLMAIMNPALRDAKRAVQMFQFGLLVLDQEKRPGEVEVIGCLALLKVKFPKLYESFVYGGGKCENLIKEMSCLFDKWDDLGCKEGLVYAYSFHPRDHVTISKNCRLFFNRTICLLAEGEEKDIIMNGSYQADNKFEISNERTWEWLQGSVDYVERAKIIRMLENLGCQSDDR